jgi:hypothetical protein
MAPRQKRFACNHVDFLKQLKHGAKGKRVQLIGGGGREQINALCECVDNILRGKVVQPTPRQKERLRKHLNVLTNLANPKVGWEKKKRELKKQAGGSLLTTVLGIALPALISFLTSQKQQQQQQPRSK